MFGALPISFYLDIARSEGVMYQLPLFLTPPKFEIKEEYLTDVFTGWKQTMNGEGKENFGVISYTDHPAFTALRNKLENDGYIKTERSHSNGDRVLYGFYLNDIYFPKGAKFPCAGAMKSTLKFGPMTYEKESNYLDIKVPWNDNLTRESNLPNMW